MRTRMLVGALMLLAGNAAQADQFDLTVQGRIIAATCDLSAGEASKQVTLDRVKAADFIDGAVPEATFAIALANCDADTVKFSFTGTSAATDPWYFANAGSAQGVATKLSSNIDGVSEVIRADGSGAGNIRTVPVVAGAASIPMVATYHRLAEDLRGGTLSTLIRVQIEYQ